MPLSPAAIRVLVVDDSAVVRQTLAAVLSVERGFAVQTASDPLFAFERLRAQRPDVIVLDLELPRMHGLMFLRKLMADDRPVPVVVCSGLQRGASAVRALEEGAVAVVEKPRFDVRGFLLESALSLVETVQGAAQARLPSRRTRGRGTTLPPAAPLAHAATPASRPRAEAIVAVGASTGGPQALLELLMGLPVDAPPVLIVQHMPAGFTRAFAERLDRSCRLEVREARAQDVPRPGLALVAPGDRHMVLRRRGAGYLVQLSDGPEVSRHRPSVDVLFRSVAQAARADAVGVILTGMGDDGADGLLEMRRAGALTLAQDESSSVVFGMPKEALARGAAQSAVPLARLAAAILSRPCQLRQDQGLTPPVP